MEVDEDGPVHVQQDWRDLQHGGLDAGDVGNVGVPVRQLKRDGVAGGRDGLLLVERGRNR